MGDNSMAHAITFYITADQLFIINKSSLLPHLANRQNIKRCISVCLPEFMCLIFWKSFTLQNLSLCITDTEKCNIFGAI